MSDSRVATPPTDTKAMPKPAPPLVIINHPWQKPVEPPPKIETAEQIAMEQHRRHHAARARDHLGRADRQGEHDPVDHWSAPVRRSGGPDQRPASAGALTDAGRGRIPADG